MSSSLMEGQPPISAYLSSSSRVTGAGGTTLLPWWTEATERAKSIPKTFSSVRNQLVANWNKIPFSLQKEGKETLVSFPAQKPSTDKLLSAVGLMFQFCQMAGLTPVPSEADDYTAIWNALDAKRDSLIGAMACLERDKISYVASVPTNISNGWDFAQWYSVMAGFHELDPNDFLKIKRVVSLHIAADAWSKGGNLVISNRIDTIVRLAAQNCCPKVDSPKSFFKSEAYFIEKKCGKAPIGGLFLPEEFKVIKEDYSERVNKVKEKYSQLPTNWTNAVPRYLSAILSTFSIEKRQTAKTLESTQSERIRPLLVWTGKGTKRTQTIIKGASLHEKLVALGGGPSVRTIANVMFSPLSGLEQSGFTTLCFKGVDRMYNHSDADWLIRQIDQLKVNNQPAASDLEKAAPYVQACVSTYLEILPDRLDEPNWRLAFAIPQ